MARGEWRDGVDPATVLATLVGSLLHRVLLEEAIVDDEFIAGVVDLVVNGVGPRDRADNGKRLPPRSGHS